MVGTKELRDLFEEIRGEAGKRASEFVSDAKMPEIVRRDEPPGIVWLGLGLILGAVIGMAIALIVAPYPGEETRRRLAQRVDKMKRQGEEGIEQIRTVNSGNGGRQAFPTPTSARERS